MPNNPTRHKLRRSQKRPKNAVPSKVGHSVKALLQGARSSTIARISAQKRSQEAWRAWLDAHLPEAVRGTVRGVVEQDGQLAVFTESAAWSARLRFALGELEEQIHKERPEISKVVVKVRPGRAEG
jgi:hypothetical protein